MSRRQPHRDARDRYRKYPTWGDREDEFEARPLWVSFKWVASVFLMVVALTVAIGFVTTGSVFFWAGAARVTNGARVQQKVYDPNNTLTQVAFFHNTCNDVRTAFAQWQSAGQKVKADTRATRSTDPIRAQQAQNELGQDTQSLIGTQQHLYATANDYNSRSAQYTANPFKDHGLPYRIKPPVNVGDLANWSPPSCG